MKKVLVLVIVLSLIVVSAAFATIANTKHNLTSTGGQTTRTTDSDATLCGFCHIPHGGNTSQAGLPLWARSNPAATYTLYGSPAGSTLNGTTLDQPGTFSKTCLSCHDGTVGIGTIIKNSVETTFAMTGNVSGGLLVDDSAATAYNPLIGTDLRNDHPVGFTFPATGYGAGNLPGISLTVTGTATAAAALVNTGTYPLFQAGGTDRFECATCHDPHLENSGTTQTKFLRSANAGICQDCHDVK